MNNSVPILDLHNTKHRDVFGVVDNFIGKHIVKFTNEVYIITGNSNTMKILVEKVLNDYELYSEESILTPGKLIINLT